MEHANSFSSVKVFSATTATDREDLGGKVTRWMNANTDQEVVDRVVRQSSDEAYHCVTIVLFLRPKSREGL